VNKPADFRVCFVGDSLTAGTGDPEHLGWVGRVCRQAAAANTSLTAYNLGVRRETSADIAQRWAGECSPRLPAGTQAHVAFCFGVNDTTEVSGQVRVTATDSVENLKRILAEAKSRYAVAMIGPPPTADTEQNQRIRLLSLQYEAACGQMAIPYLPVFGSLSENPVWTRQVAKYDGAHPQAEGYAEFARLVMQWNYWWFRSTTT
jgi:lysophospholipase L1-like esterase